MPDETPRGAVDLDECRTRWPGSRTCHCEQCARCGWGKHMAVHGPAYGEPPGSAPYDHEFVPSGRRFVRPPQTTDATRDRGRGGRG